MKSIPHKKLSVLLLILLLCISLTACSPSPERLLEDARSAVEKEQPDWNAALAILDQIPDQEMEEVQEFRSECYFQIGCVKLFSDFSDTAASEAFTQCVEHSQASAYREVTKYLIDEDIYGALDAISQILNNGVSLHTADEWFQVLQHSISRTVIQNMTLQERFALENVLRPVFQLWSPTLTEACDRIEKICEETAHQPKYFDTDFNNYSYRLRGDINPHEMCVGSGDGPKLLIVRYNTFKSGIHIIDFDMMRQLPAAYQPASLEEVNTILYLDYGYAFSGRYWTTEAYKLGISWYLYSLSALDESSESASEFELISKMDTIWGEEPPEVIQFVQGSPHPEYYISFPDISYYLRKTLTTYFETH